MDSIWTKTARLATHFPLLNKHGGYFLKLYQHRSCVLALENVPGVQGMYVDENKRGLFFRNYGGMLLLGGGGHRTGKERFACRDYPGAPITARWATQDCMTLDGAPYIRGHRLQQVGDDLLHGGGIPFDRPGAGAEKSLWGAVLPLPDRPPPPAGGQQPGIRPRDPAPTAPGAPTWAAL